MSFLEGTIKTLRDACERYKSMMRRCLDYRFVDLTQIYIFGNGLLQQPKSLLDPTVNGSLLSKSVEDVILIIEKM